MKYNVYLKKYFEFGSLMGNAGKIFSIKDTRVKFKMLPLPIMITYMWVLRRMHVPSHCCSCSLALSANSLSFKYFHFKLYWIICCYCCFSYYYYCFLWTIVSLFWQKFFSNAGLNSNCSDCFHKSCSHSLLPWSVNIHFIAIKLL